MGGGSQWREAFISTIDRRNPLRYILPVSYRGGVICHGVQVGFGIAVQNQVRISKRGVVDQIIPLCPLEAVIGNFVFNGGAVNGNPASITEKQFYTGCVNVELTGYKFAHGHTSKMFLR